MSDIEKGHLEVGHNETNVIVNHFDLEKDENGIGFIEFSPNQARNFAALLIKHAREIEDRV